ncbi:hypothetical protein RN001_005650 [Aquatica leii]|uniref:YqaJ viral recombinase domain-containing protein n=1 Tax=Aquatica leii TaxID=1421715 RepID=A0AAN7SAP6_9COLE|nr:hypothetical protein RN001_005650 [Aquatica leii]
MASEGFVKASTNNLPCVYIFMVNEFIRNDERFNAAEFKGVKAAFKFKDSFNSAIGYVEVKREGSLCTVQERICPEHRVKSKPYSVCLILDERNEKIINVYCKDCAASLGGCKHVLAFLMWVHRRSEDPAPTEVTSYWLEPRLSGVGTTDTKMNVLSLASVDNSTFRDEVLNIGKQNESNGQLILCGKLTGTQIDSPMWHEMRFGRVTASKLYEFSKCNTSDGTLVESIIDSGLCLLPSYPVFGASPDGITSEYVIEVKCPSSEKILRNYIKNGDPTEKFKAQLHLQMLCTNKQKGLFCVADPNFDQNNLITILTVDYDENYMHNLIVRSLNNWKNFVFSGLYKSVK